MTYKQFSNNFRKLFKIRLNKEGLIFDLKTIRNLREAVRYLTKEDPSAVVYNIDEDYTSTVYRMRSYSEERKRLSFGDSVTSRLNPGQRQVAKDYFEDEKRREECERQISMFNDTELRSWQSQLLALVDRSKEINDDRAIYWIVDHMGNMGKSYLARYLASTGACLFTTVENSTIAYQYNGENVVCIDLSRDTDFASLRLVSLEHLKDGYITSTKYEPKTKHFVSPQVVVFANRFPDKNKFSPDRWRVYLIEDEETLTRCKCFNQILPCTESHVMCGNK